MLQHCTEIELKLMRRKWGPERNFCSGMHMDVRLRRQHTPIPHSHTSRPRERHVEKREGVAKEGER